MSRIGNRVLEIPKETTVTIDPNNTVTVKGPKGTLTNQFNSAIKIKIDDNKIIVTRDNDTKSVKQLHGTTNALISNMLIGVTKEYQNELKLVGVGYRAKQQGDTLTLSLGYSHPIEYKIPSGITITCPKPVSIIISGIDKQQVNQIAAHIRDFRRPEPYKGKGVQYKNEVIHFKEGKSAGK